MKNIIICIILIMVSYSFKTGLDASEPEIWNLNVKNYHYVIVPNPRTNPGLFSVFCSVIGALNAFDEGHYKGISVELTSGRYVDLSVGPNWWEYFFEPIHINMDENPKRKKLSDMDLSRFAWWPLSHLERHHGYYLIQKYIHLKPEIEAKILAIQADLFENSYIIGIHYRGTDKLINEARRIPYNIVREAVVRKIKLLEKENISDYKIFIATDEQKFLDYMKKSFTCPIVYTGAKRSTNNTPVHVGTYSSNYQRGEDAIIDCLLLSRCDTLIRTLSNLSFCSELFNPDMPSEVLQ